MSGKHKYLEKSRVWKREENVEKLGKKWRKQKPDLAVEDECKNYKIRGEKREMGERIEWGTTATRSDMEDDERR